MCMKHESIVGSTDRIKTGYAPTDLGGATSECGFCGSRPRTKKPRPSGGAVR